METQVSKSFLSMQNQQKNKPLDGGLPWLPEQVNLKMLAATSWIYESNCPTWKRACSRHHHLVNT